MSTNRRTAICMGVTVTAVAGICATAAVVNVHASDNQEPQLRPVVEQVEREVPTVTPPMPTEKPAEQPADLPAGPLGIPGIAMKAYQDSADRLGKEQPGCAMDWTLIAGIKKVESNHGNNGAFSIKGDSITPILGPVLDGHLPGSEVIKDSDGGEFDGNKEYDRAVGPGQFLPSTWKRLGKDGNGDGKADPNNIFDSAYSTGAYLCQNGGSMEDPAQREAAILTYNNSHAYVQNVNAWATAYATGVEPDPADLPPIHPAPEEKIPEKCPDGTEGKPEAAPETEAPGTPEEKVTVKGCNPKPSDTPPPPPAPEPAPAPAPDAPAPAPAPAPQDPAGPAVPPPPAPAPAPAPQDDIAKRLQDAIPHF
ncbi:lytic transglycosylase domain-containing protein [Dietzia sp.]|uniref:lytic transglycosylase domain-containing protein n=1 Tax=Dietzia sp. TaxID=1871616 RepID=UPI002FDB539E